MEEYPLVSIIIVNYNGKKYLEKCLDALFKIDYKNYEAIVVDNNSRDESVEFIKKNYPLIKLVQLKENFGYAEPNNIGAKNANGNFLIFLNNDTIVSSNFLSELICAADQYSDVAIFQSLLLKPNNDIDSSGDFIDVYGRAYNSKEKPQKIKEILSARGAAMMIRKKVFSDLKGFDEKFFASFEDVDLGWRAWLYGHRVVLVPKSVVYHTGGQTVKQMSPKIQFHGVKNSLILRLTNFELSFAIKSLVTIFFVILLRKSFGIQVIKDPEQTKSIPSIKTMLRSIGWVLKNFGYVLSKRREVNSKRVLSTQDLISRNLITK